MAKLAILFDFYFQRRPKPQIFVLSSNRCESATEPASVSSRSFLRNSTTSTSTTCCSECSKQPMYGSGIVQRTSTGKTRNRNQSGWLVCWGDKRALRLSSSFWKTETSFQQSTHSNLEWDFRGIQGQLWWKWAYFPKSEEKTAKFEIRIHAA